MGTPLRSSALFKIDLASVLRGPQPGGFLEQMSAPQAVKSVKKMGKIEQGKLSLHSKGVATYAAPVSLPELPQKKAKPKAKPKAAVANRQVGEAGKIQEAEAAHKQQQAAANRRRQKAKSAQQRQKAEAALQREKVKLAKAAREQQEAESARKRQKAETNRKRREAAAAREQQEAELARERQEAAAARREQEAERRKLQKSEPTSCLEPCAVDRKDIHTTLIYVDGCLRDPVGGVGVFFVDKRLHHLNLSLRLQCICRKHKRGKVVMEAAEQAVNIVRNNLELFKESNQSIVIRAEITSLVSAMQSDCLNYKWKRKMGNLYRDLYMKIADLKPLKITFEHVLKADKVKEHIEAHNLAKKAISLKAVRSPLPVTVSKKNMKKQNIVVETPMEPEQIKLPEPEELIQPCSLSSPTIRGGGIPCEYETAIRNNDWLKESFSQLHL